jgi:hypothetical protein
VSGCLGLLLPFCKRPVSFNNLRTIYQKAFANDASKTLQGLNPRHMPNVPRNRTSIYKPLNRNHLPTASQYASVKQILLYEVFKNSVLSFKLEELGVQAF